MSIASIALKRIENRNWKHWLIQLLQLGNISQVIQWTKTNLIFIRSSPQILFIILYELNKVLPMQYTLMQLYGGDRFSLLSLKSCRIFLSLPFHIMHLILPFDPLLITHQMAKLMLISCGVSCSQLQPLFSSSSRVSELNWHCLIVTSTSHAFYSPPLKSRR